MIEIVTRKIIKPQDCVVAICIPVTFEAYTSAQIYPENRDFVPNCFGSWLEYRYHIINSTSKVLPEIEKLGVSVIKDVTISNFADLLTKNAYSIVMLIAHWKDDAIEFADGLENISEIVNIVPPSFEGILDLCICHPTNLAMKLREVRPNCRVRFTNAKSTLTLWLYYFLALFKKLELEEITYPAAHEFINREFKKRLEREIQS